MKKLITWIVGICLMLSTIEPARATFPGPPPDPTTIVPGFGMTVAALRLMLCNSGMAVADVEMFIAAICNGYIVTGTTATATTTAATTTMATTTAVTTTTATTTTGVLGTTVSPVALPAVVVVGTVIIAGELYYICYYNGQVTQLNQQYLQMAQQQGLTAAQAQAQLAAYNASVVAAQGGYWSQYWYYCNPWNWP